MKRGRVRFVLGSLALASAGAGAIACSSSSSNPKSDAVEIPLGGACDPSAPNTCEQPNDACSIAVCSATVKVCQKKQSPEAGTACGVTTTCATTADCQGGLVCGYLQSGSCGAPGTCVVAANCNTSVALCGCDGKSVPCVNLDYAAAPVSPGFCALDASSE